MPSGHAYQSYGTDHPGSKVLGGNINKYYDPESGVFTVKTGSINGVAQIFQTVTGTSQTNVTSQGTQSMSYKVYLIY